MQCSAALCCCAQEVPLSGERVSIEPHHSVPHRLGPLIAAPVPVPLLLSLCLRQLCRRPASAVQSAAVGRPTQRGGGVRRFFIIVIIIIVVIVERVVALPDQHGSLAAGPAAVLLLPPLLLLLVALPCGRYGGGGQKLRSRL